MKVTRIHEEWGSYISPPIDQEWDQLTQLQWHAAIVEMDTGIPIKVTDEGRVWVEGKLQTDIRFLVFIGNTGASPMRFDTAWTYLNGAAAMGEACSSSTS